MIDILIKTNIIIYYKFEFLSARRVAHVYHCHNQGNVVRTLFLCLFYKLCSKFIHLYLFS